MVTITNATLRRTVFKTVYDILNDSSNLTTTRTEGGNLVTYTAKVLAAFPIDDKSFSTPIIVVQRPFKEDEEQIGTKLSSGILNVSVVIEIYAKSNDLCQEFVDLVDNELTTNFSTIKGYGLRELKLVDEPTLEPIIIDAKTRMHQHYLVLTGKRAR